MHFSVIVLLFIVSVTASGGAGFMYKKITALHETGSDARGENYGQRQLGKRLYRARQGGGRGVVYAGQNG